MLSFVNPKISNSNLFIDIFKVHEKDYKVASGLILDALRFREK